MSNLFVLMRNIFEAHASVVNLLGLLGLDLIWMYCSFFQQGIGRALDPCANSALLSKLTE